jgi:hypothetical protein
MRKLLTLLIFALFNPIQAQVPWLTGESRAEDIRIKLVTFGPGDDVPSWWGHGGIIVEDIGNREAKIYNFGLYSFDRTMLMKFAMGRLIFSVGTFSVPGYLKYYEKMNRDVRIQTLDIPPEKKLKMAYDLAVNVLPENRDYLYDHYYDNCSTRLRDIIDKAVDGALYEATDVQAGMTLRDHTKRYVGHNPPMEMLLMFLMNDEIDQPIKEWDEMFLPDELEKYVANLSYADESGNEHQLVSDYYIYYKADRDPVPDKVPVHWPGAFFVGIIIGIIPLSITLWLKNTGSQWAKVIFGVYITMLGLLIGIPGLGLGIIASFTDHVITYHNENLFLANPVTFLLIPIGIMLSLNWRKALKWLKWIWILHIVLMLLLIFLKLLPAFDQDNGLVFALIIPLYLLNGYAVLKAEQAAVNKSVS